MRSVHIHTGRILAVQPYESQSIYINTCVCSRYTFIQISPIFVSTRIRQYFMDYGCRDICGYRDNFFLFFIIGRRRGRGKGGKRGGKWRGNESEMGISPAAKEVEAKVDGVSFRGGWMSIGKLRKGM